MSATLTDCDTCQAPTVPATLDTFGDCPRCVQLFTVALGGTPARDLPTCPRCDGPWGTDLTCLACCQDDGTPYPLPAAARHSPAGLLPDGTCGRDVSQAHAAAWSLLAVLGALALVALDGRHTDRGGLLLVAVLTGAAAFRAASWAARSVFGQD